MGVRGRAGKLGRRLSGLEVAFVVGIVCSLTLLVYLNASDLHAQYVAETHISQMEKLYSGEFDPVRLEYERQAHLYNDRLAGCQVDEELLEYHKQLFYREEPMMASIEIPKISVKLPIYHGVEENALMAGVGHWERSSLPVGGSTTHCVLMAHTGMRNTRMFDDLHLLEPGDKFVVRALNEPHAYEVYDVEVVVPSEVPGKLEIEEGKDLVTLVTCTPHGVNTHRLLVHAKRCDYTEAEVGRVGLNAYVNDRNRPLLAAALLAATLAFVAAVGKARKTRMRRSPAVEAKGNEDEENQNEKD